MTKRQKFLDIVYPTGFLLCCMLLCSMAVLIVGGMITGIRDAEQLQAEVPVLPLTASLLAYVVTLLYNKRQFAVEAARFGKDENRWTPLQIFLVCAATAAGGLLWSHVLTHSPLMDLFPGYTQHAAGAFTGQPLPLLLVTTVVAGPLAEEWIFRGMTYRRARAALGAPLAMCLSAALFGIYHTNMIQFLYAFPLGILFAVCYEKSGSLLMPVLAHMLVNFGACILSRF